eukprot:jgi/Chlat1/7654/Chrsp64S07123
MVVVGKNTIKVWVRLRPVAAITDSLAVAGDGRGLAVANRKKDQGGAVNNQAESISFKLDGILQNATQEATYAAIAADVVDAALAGYNGTIFAYGQTGSGKTYTMTGDTTAYNQRGIVPRAIHQIFKEIETRADREYVVRVSYLEVYNECLYDLLAESPGAADNLMIVEENNGTQVRGMERRVVTSEQEALSAFFQGELSRSTTTHALNETSSRSHCVFTLHLEVRAGTDVSERVTTSKLNLVDLAGSERTKKTGVSGQTLKEAMFINKSLTFLEQGAAHVSFRSCKLTAVLRDALGGNCRTAMVACVWPEETHLEETVSTLRFAARVKTITTQAIVNESSDPSVIIRSGSSAEKYERQIAELKQELAMRDTFSGRGRVVYDEYTEAERQALNATVKEYLSGRSAIDTLPMETLKQIKETFAQCKVAYQALQAEMEQEIRKSRDSAARDASAANVATAQRPMDSAAARDMVGDIDDSTPGFFVGEAPANARPTAPLSDDENSPKRGSVVAVPATKNKVAINGGMLSAEPSTASSPLARDGSVFRNLQRTTSGTDATLDKNAAFEKFKVDDATGRVLAEALRGANNTIRDARQKLKEVASAVNAAKKSIDEDKDALEAKRAERMRANLSAGTADDGDAELIDEEEFACMQRLKQAKMAYRKAFDHMRDIREDIEQKTFAANEYRQKLLDAFNDWYNLSTRSGFLSGNDMEEEEEDISEQFERMNRERIIMEDPEAISFHGARKTVHRQKTGMSNAYHGDKGRAVALRKQEKLSGPNAMSTR